MTNSTTHSVTERLVQGITQGLRNGLFVPGQRLIETEFVERYGVSRSAVREAFQRLVADDILVMERHRGVTVREVTRKEIEDVFRVRQSLETLAVRCALPALHEHPEPLLACHQEILQAAPGNDMTAFVRLNDAFHQIICEAADNAVLTEALRRLGNTIFQVQFRATLKPGLIQEAAAEHDEIVQAILRGNEEAACRAAESHVIRSRDTLLAAYDANLAAGRIL
jgi:DNA-binding GntR family transcriptional regulator